MRLNDHLGLACTGWTWSYAALLVVLWGVAPLVARRRGGPQRSLAASPFGFFWVGFTVDVVIRFFLLAYESVEFGNDTFRLADVPPRNLDRAMVLVIVYWVSVTVGFVLWPRRSAGGPLRPVEALGGDGRWDRQLLVLLASTACIVAGSGLVPLPLALATPIGLLGRLWIVPASFVWAEHWRGMATGRTRWLVLAPALVQFALSPFREHLVPLALVPLLTLVCVRGRMPRRAVAGAVAAVLTFLAIGPLTSAYRDVRWGGHAVSSVTQGDPESDQDFQELPDPSWLITIRRFHAFDSLLLTVDLVPNAFPFTGEPVLMDGFLRGLVPRVLVPSKARSNRGQEFARTIWSYDSEIESDAAIAPSMPGDLYWAGGASYVLAGALLWGLLLGALDAWAAALRPSARAAVLLLFATQVLPSVERDFAHCVATLVQTLVVLGVAGGLARRLWRLRAPAARWVAAGSAA